MDIKPVENRIIAKTVDTSQTTASGILVQGAKGKTSNVGEVLAVGPLVQNVKVGDRVIYIDNMTFDYLGENYVTFRENQILGLI